MKSHALLAIFSGSAAIAAVYATTLVTGSAPAWGGAVFAVATAVVLVALMVTGASRRGSIGRLWIPFGIAFLVLAGGFLLALMLPAERAGSRLILGLPPRAAIIMYLIGLFPAFVIPVAYAVTFDRLTLSEADLARVRAMRSSAAPRPPDDEHAVPADAEGAAGVDPSNAAGPEGP
jgi:hypothetical protein